MFYDKEIPKVDSNRTYLSVIRSDFVVKRDGSCYPKVVIKQCNYI